MIHFSFSSVLMTILMSNLMLVIIARCFRNENVMAGIGYKLMAVFCAVTLVRLLLPLELPFTKTFALPRVLSNIATAFQHSYGTFLGIRLSLWTAFCIIWIVGAIVFWAIYIHEHSVLRYYVRTYGKDVTNEEPFVSMLEELCSEKQRQKIRILKTLGVESPMILGLCRPKILLPANVNVSNDDTLFAIKHEIYHYAHHDLWIKTATKCLTVAYWWNPYCHQLNKRISTLMEMRIDDNIMKKDPLEATKYVLSLHHHVTNMNHEAKEDDHSASLCSRERSSFYQRLCMMHHQSEKRNYLTCVGMLILMVGIYIGSYLVILEASTYEFNIEGYHFTTKGNNVYAIENEDGSYSVYTTNGFFLETIDTLEYYPWNITIYSSEEEYHEKNQ